MPHVKSMAAPVAVALILGGCSAGATPPQGRGRLADQRTESGRFQCLVAHHLAAQKVGQTEIQIGSPPAGPTVQFEPTAGAAETRQIEGTAQGAELIGSALVYPHQAPGAELTVVENCIGQGVAEPKLG